MTLKFWKGMWWCQLMKIWIIQTISNIFHTSKRFAYLLQLFLTKEWQLAKSFKCFVSRLNSDIGISKKYLDKTVIITWKVLVSMRLFIFYVLSSIFNKHKSFSCYQENTSFISFDVKKIVNICKKVIFFVFKNSIVLYAQ